MQFLSSNLHRKAFDIIKKIKDMELDYYLNKCQCLYLASGFF